MDDAIIQIQICLEHLTDDIQGRTRLKKNKVMTFCLRNFQTYICVVRKKWFCDAKVICLGLKILGCVKFEQVEL